MAKGSKATYQFVCQECGATSPRWFGKCPACGTWNSMAEERVSPEGRRGSAYAARSGSAPVAITRVGKEQEERIPTAIGELDRVLGGGFVPGSVVLVGGDPGIGKSTLALQMLDRLSRGGRRAMYATGEESPEQVRLRAERLRVGTDSLYVFSETSVDALIEQMEALQPGVTVVDSIQTMNTQDFPSAQGSVGQIRECASRLMQYAKLKGTAVFLIGHVTKEGAIAGPKVLEHLVDTVLYFEGGKELPLRVLRAFKNRFGSTNEIGVFEMGERGLAEVENPSQIFLSERPERASGSVVVPSLEGTRPILVEIQALVSPCGMGVPRRTTIGLDPNRVSLLVAVLEKRAGLSIVGNDIYMNVPGGVRIDEPAIDLGVCLCIASSLYDRPIDSEVVVLGEVGLAGEVRGVSQVEMRLREAEKLGFKSCVLPRINRERLSARDTGLDLIGVSRLEKAVAELL